MNYVQVRALGLSGKEHKEHMSRDMCFPTLWHFDKCRLRRAYGASF